MNPLPTHMVKPVPTHMMNPLPSHIMNTLLTHMMNLLPPHMMKLIPTHTLTRFIFTSLLPTYMMNPLSTHMTNILLTHMMNTLTTHIMNTLTTHMMNILNTYMMNTLPTHIINTLTTHMMNTLSTEAGQSGISFTFQCPQQKPLAANSQHASEGELWANEPISPRRLGAYADAATLMAATRHHLLTRELTGTTVLQGERGNRQMLSCHFASMQPAIGSLGPSPPPPQTGNLRPVATNGFRDCVTLFSQKYIKNIYWIKAPAKCILCLCACICVCT